MLLAVELYEHVKVSMLASIPAFSRLAGEMVLTAVSVMDGSGFAVDFWCKIKLLTILLRPVETARSWAGDARYGNNYCGVAT